LIVDITIVFDGTGVVEVLIIDEGLIVSESSSGVVVDSRSCLIDE